MKKVVLLKADGTREVLTPEKKPSLEQMQKWVDGWVESVHRNPTTGQLLRWEGQAVVVVVNEEGLLRHLPLNRQATEAFGFTVVGDCFVLQGWRL